MCAVCPGPYLRAHNKLSLGLDRILPAIAAVEASTLDLVPSPTVPSFPPSLYPSPLHGPQPPRALTVPPLCTAPHRRQRSAARTYARRPHTRPCLRAAQMGPGSTVGAAAGLKESEQAQLLGRATGGRGGSAQQRYRHSEPLWLRPPPNLKAPPRVSASAAAAAAEAAADEVAEGGGGPPRQDSSTPPVPPLLGPISALRRDGRGGGGDMTPPRPSTAVVGHGSAIPPLTSPPAPAHRRSPPPRLPHAGVRVEARQQPRGRGQRLLLHLDPARQPGGLRQGPAPPAALHAGQPRHCPSREPGAGAQRAGRQPAAPGARYLG